jgi:succinate dehydrogenase / fumarate reductase, cytochrome b subunit
MSIASKAMDVAPGGVAPSGPSQPLSLPQPSRPAQLVMLWQNSVGKKFLMAATGIVLFLYVLAHLLGNLQIYMGAEKINAYAHLLHANGGVLWTARIILLAAVLTHAIAGIILTLEKSSARPIAYAEKTNIQGTVSSRTMIYSGVLIGFFIVYHVLHLTVGGAGHPSYIDLDPYHNVVAGFRVVPAAIAYIIAMIGVGGHLWHGLYSMFQSLGFRHPRFTPGLRMAAATIATLIALGDISIPIAVLSGIVG